MFKKLLLAVSLLSVATNFISIVSISAQTSNSLISSVVTINDQNGNGQLDVNLLDIKTNGSLIVELEDSKIIEITPSVVDALEKMANNNKDQSLATPSNKFAAVTKTINAIWSSAKNKVGSVFTSAYNYCKGNIGNAYSCYEIASTVCQWFGKC